MARRYEEKVNLRPVDTSLSRPFESHAQNLRAFADQMGQIGRQYAQAGQQWGAFADKKMTEAATKQAGQDYAAGGMQTKSGASTFSNVYNDTMRAAYLVSLSTEAEQDLRRIERESQDLATFNQTAEAYRKGKLSSLDSVVAPQFAQYFDKLTHSARMRVQDTEISTNMKNAEGELLRGAQAARDSLLRAVNEGDSTEIELASNKYNTILAQLNSQNKNTYSDAWVGEQATKTAKDISNQGVYRMVDEAAAVSLDNGFAKLDELASETPEGYNPQEWEAVLSKKYRELYALENKQRAELEANAKAIEDQMLLNRGDYLFEYGVIDPYKTNEESKQDLKAINLHYDAMSEQWRELPLQDFITQNVNYVGRVGVMPLRLERTLNAFSRNGSPEQALAAAEMYGQIQQSTPQAFKDLPDETRAFLSMVNESIIAGDAINAVETARKYAYGLTKQEKESIKLQTQEWKAKNSEILFKKLDDKLEEDFDTLLTFGAPDAPEGMKSEFAINFDRHMMTAGANPDIAANLAYQDIKRTWGVTKIGGDRTFMKYAPEAVYGIPGVDNRWITDQFEKEMTEAGIENAYLVVNPNTAGREKQPAYMIFAKDENGVGRPVVVETENGIQIQQQWRPDFKLTEEYAAITDAPTGLPQGVKDKIQKKREVQFKRSIGIIENRIRKGETAEKAINNAAALGTITPMEKQRLIEYFNANSNE